MKWFKKHLNIIWAIVSILTIATTVFFVRCISQSEYASLESKYASLENDYNTLQNKNESLQISLEKLQEEIDDLNKQIEELEYELQDYRDTGIRIYTSDKLPKILKYGYGLGIVSFYDEGRPSSDYVKLLNNSDAQNPTFEELMLFLSNDDTDIWPYAPEYSEGKICGWFAERVHNYAEKTGIKAAFVIINFIDEWSGHALNAFNTLDKGLVFIDCTGQQRSQYIEPFSLYAKTYKIGNIGNNDTIAYVKVNKPFGRININLPYDIEYSEYDRWQRDVENISRRFSLADTHTELGQIKEESDNSLGSFYKTGGLVESIDIYW